MRATYGSHQLLALLAAALLAACEPTVVVERDTTTRIPDGATWTWSAPDGDGLAPGAGDVLPSEPVAATIANAIESTLIANQRPVAVGIPGYVVPMDQQASLFVKAPSRIISVESHPAGAVEATAANSAPGSSAPVPMLTAMSCSLSSRAR